MKPICYIGHEGSLVRFGNVTDILHIQKIWYANFFRGNFEGQLHVPTVIALVQLLVIDQIRSMNVKQSAAVS